MAQQHTMIPSTSVHTRFRRKSAPSDQSFVGFLSGFSTRPTDAHSQLPSPPREYSQYLLTSECHQPNEGPSNHNNSNNSYPSPPSVDPHGRAYIVLPPLIDLDSPRRSPGLRSIDTYTIGGVLDSPLVMYRTFLQSQAPPTPPQTLPTSTLCLPLTDSEGYLSSPVSIAHELPNQEELSDFWPGQLEVFTPSSRSSCSTLQSSPPLSPVSPNSVEWCPHILGLPAAHLPPISSRIPISAVKDGDGLPVLYRNSDDSFLHDGSPDNPGLVSLDHPTLSLLNNRHLGCLDACPEYQPLFAVDITDSPKSIVEDLDPIDFDDSPLPLPFPSLDVAPDHLDSGYLEEIPADLIQNQELDEPPHMQLERQKDEQLPGPNPFSHICSPSIRHSSLPELDDICDIDLPDFMSPPCSPSRRTSTPLPEDDLDLEPLNGRPSSFYPDFDHEMSNDTVMLSPPESPALSVLSLPGADTDEDLIPVDLAPTKPPSTHTSPFHPNRLLGLDDDSTPRSSASLRSPSPEPCAVLDMNILAPQIPEDAEFRKLCRLMKKTKDEERAARQMENLIEDEEGLIRSISGGSSPAALEACNKLVDARRKTKKSRERVREVGTLLRVKLTERGLRIGKDGSGKPTLVPTFSKELPSVAGVSGNTEDAMKVDLLPRSPKLPRITNARQLLAKMVLDRHEPKYNPNVRTGLPSNKGMVKSPLRFAVDVDTTCDNRPGEDSTPVSLVLHDVTMDGVDVKMSDLLQDLDLGMEGPLGP